MGRPGRPPRKIPPTFALEAAKGLTQAALETQFKAGKDTVRRWLKEPAVVEEIAEITTGLKKSLRQMYADSLPKAVAYQIGVVTAPQQLPTCPTCGGARISVADRLRAADSLIRNDPERDLTQILITNQVPETFSVEDDREILEQAASILSAKGEHELSASLRAFLA